MQISTQTTQSGLGARPRLRGADAVMVQHNGLAMAANYGSVAGELAICMKRVGLIDRPELELLELRGRSAWLDQVLGADVGDPVAPAGHTSTVAGTETWRLSPDRAMVLGAHAAVARWRRLVGHFLLTGNTITCADRSSEFSAMLLVGPRAPRLLASAGLEEDMAVGVVGSWTLAGANVLLAREAIDSFQLLLPTEGGPAARQALLQAGAPLELGHVGFEALERLTAAHRSSPVPLLI